MLTRHLSLGKAGEELAGTYLQTLGFEIVSRNWRCRGGELDIICTSGKDIVFVEVKTRTDQDRGLPGEALDEKKQKRLIKAAGVYLSRQKLWDRPSRFDLVAVSFDATGCRLEHVTDVIQVSQTLVGRHAHWQPW
jgi:putative endonuclease